MHYYGKKKRKERKHVGVRPYGIGITVVLSTGICNYDDKIRLLFIGSPNVKIFLIRLHT